MKFHFGVAERQHFSFFLLLAVSFDQRMNEEHICKGAPGQGQRLLWLRSWRNAPNYWETESISWKNYCNMLLLLINKVTSKQRSMCFFFSLTHCKPTRLCFRSIGNELFSFDPAVYFRRMIMNGGDFYTGRALSKNYRTPFCGVFCSRCCLFFPCLKCPL